MLILIMQLMLIFKIFILKYFNISLLEQLSPCYFSRYNCCCVLWRLTKFFY